MAKPRRRSQGPPQRLILDSGAVIALSRNDLRARSVLAAAWETGTEVTIPAVVLAETVRGTAKDASLNRIVTAVGNVSAAEERSGRVAGYLLGRAKSSSTVDALVVAAAIELGGGVVLTGDPHDLASLASGHPEVVIRRL